MSKLNIFNEAEQASPDDFTNIGKFARADAQAIVGGAIGAPSQWARFTITQPTAVTMTISAGTLFVDNVVYDSDPKTLNLQVYLPLVAGDTKWVAVLARGNADTINDNRIILTDVDANTTVQVPVPVLDVLDIDFVVQDGLASPGPVRPIVPADQCCIAFVLLSTTGIQAIEPGENWRLKTLFEVTGRVLVLENEMLDIQQDVASLRTDLSNLAGQLRSIPRPELMNQLQTDVAALRRLNKLPAAARAYWYDNGLFVDDWDTLNSNWLARIWTGIRFPFANIINNQMGLLTPGDPNVKTVDNVLMPQWTEITRIAVEGGGGIVQTSTDANGVTTTSVTPSSDFDGYKDISSQVHTVTTAVEHEIARTSVSYGPTINVCQNQDGFAAVAGAEVGQTFTANGQSYVNDGLSTSTTPWSATQASPAAWNADPNSAGHQIYAVQELQIDSWTDVYWTYVTNTYGVNGSIYGQTFLNSQMMVATSIDLPFKRVDTTGGDVHVFLCECKATGEPVFTNCISQGTLTAANLTVGWNKCAIKPALLQTGKRYAWFTVTVGNHAISTTSGNKYAQGSLFWCTDGVWAQGDPQVDFGFRINAAQFGTTRCVVEMQPLTLDNGMTEIRLLYAGWAPSGTQLVWEILPQGQTVWSMLVPQGDGNPLVGLPPLCRLRATFVGTTDLMPSIVMDSNARTWAARMRGTMAACSKQQPFGFTTTSITLTVTVDNFNPSTNAWANKLLKADGTILSPDTTTVTVDPDRPQRRTFKSLFSTALGSGVTQMAAMPTGTTSNVVQVPFIQDLLMSAA